MISGENCSHDWQVHVGDICVLPVGAFEQHGSHLPVETDALQAAYFAKLVAESLDAALLPVISIATSLEHSGFRGSFSLRPETLMAMVRDLADEVERQGFRILVILNAHGGNYALGPVVRDINRSDRALKILLVDYWDFWPAGVTCANHTAGPEIHAGEGETSVMMVIRPDLVRAPGTDSPARPPEPFPLAQKDLNSFGVGHFNPAGVIGYPSFASVEKGQRIIAGVRERMIPVIEDRIRRLREQPRYAGAGGIAIRAMGATDLTDAMRVKSLAGWNQLEADWRIFLAEKSGCFAAVHQGQVIGTVATIVYPSTGAGDVAWIGMVLVDPQFRRMGIGTQLLDRAVAALAGCPSIGLDATPAGQEVYLKRGFVAERTLARWICAAVPTLPETGAAEAVNGSHHAGIAAMDRSVFGSDRGQILRALHAGDSCVAHCLVRGGRVAAYCLSRPGANAHHLGPVAADNLEDAIAVASAALRALSGRSAIIDVPDAQIAFASWLGSHGFSRQRPFTRMFRGKPSGTGAAEREFAITGPEFG